MAINFIPPLVELGTITQDSLTITNQDVIVETSMDAGYHSSISGSPTFKNIDMTCVLDGEKLVVLETFLDEVLNKKFYSTFPDPKRGGIQENKYYSFSLVSSSNAEEYLTTGYYTKSLQLRWHFRVPPIDRT